MELDTVVRDRSPAPIEGFVAALEPRAVIDAGSLGPGADEWNVAKAIARFSPSGERTRSCGPRSPAGGYGEQGRPTSR